MTIYIYDVSYISIFVLVWGFSIRPTRPMDVVHPSLSITIHPRTHQFPIHPYPRTPPSPTTPSTNHTTFTIHVHPRTTPSTIPVLSFQYNILTKNIYITFLELSYSVFRSQHIYIYIYIYIYVLGRQIHMQYDTYPNHDWTITIGLNIWYISDLILLYI